MKSKALIIALLLFVFAQAGAYAASDESVAEALGLIPQGLGEEQIVTRELLAYSAVKLADGNSVSEGETPFVDLQDNAYTGYVKSAYNLGILKGVSENQFSPEGAATFSMIDAAMVRALGYEQIVSFYGSPMEAYVKTAEMLGINDDVPLGAENFVTVGQLSKMLENALTSDVLKLTSGGGTAYENTGEYYLCKNLGYTVYKGHITKIFSVGTKASVLIDGLVYAKRNETILSGTVLTFAVPEGKDFYDFEYVTGEIWVNDNEEIVYVKPKRDIEVIYTHIYSVNGDSDENNKYDAEYVNRMVLYNDTEKALSFSPNAVIKYNGEIAEGTLAAYADRFAKVVTDGRDILFVDCYDADFGGLVTEVTGDKIVYAKQDGVTGQLDELADYKEILVFINGQKKALSDLKTKTVINFHKNGDMLFIEASEKAYSEILNSTGSGTITIGNISYETAPLCFYSTDGKYYRLNSGAEELYGKKITAYFDSLDRCAYVTLGAGEEAVVGDFIGVLMSYTFDENNETYNAHIYVMEPALEKKWFKVSDKVKFEDGLTEIAVRQSAGNLNDSAVYLFELNQKGEIGVISDTKPVYGFNKSAMMTYFVDEPTNPYVGMSTDGGYKTLFFGNAPTYVLFEKDGKAEIQKTTWAQLARNNVYNDSVTVNIYGRELDAVPRMLLLTGGVDDIYYNNLLLGIITDKTIKINSDEEVVYQIDIQGAATTIEVSKEMGESLSEYGMFFYYPSRGYGADTSIVIASDIMDCSGDPDEWNLAALGLSRGTVKRIDDRRVFVDDGTEYGNPMYMYESFILKYNEDASGADRFERISYNEVEPGSEIIYYLRGELRGVIVLD